MAEITTVHACRHDHQKAGRYILDVTLQFPGPNPPERCTYIAERGDVAPVNVELLRRIDAGEIAVAPAQPD